MVEFKPAKHTSKEYDVIEIWVDGVFRAALYPHGSTGVKIVSSHIPTDGVIFDTAPPQALFVELTGAKPVNDQRRYCFGRYCFACGVSLHGSVTEHKGNGMATEHKDECPIGQMIKKANEAIGVESTDDSPTNNTEN